MRLAILKSLTMRLSMRSSIAVVVAMLSATVSHAQTWPATKPFRTKGGYELLTTKAIGVNKTLYLLRCMDGTTDCGYATHDVCGSARADSMDEYGEPRSEPYFLQDAKKRPMRVLACENE